VTYPNYKHVGGYINTDPYYISPEEEAAMYDGPPDWDDDAIPVNIFGETDEDR
jgi:hypothetical protein